MAEAADVVVVAPATANTIAKMALGVADDALTTTVLATRAPVLICPAMDGHMYENPATQANLTTLKKRGVSIAGPVEGHLASGIRGYGRMLEPKLIVGHMSYVLGLNGDLSGRKIVVTASGTQEPIDPVRIITNRSSGKQGFAIAEAARDRGAEVKLVSGPSALADPVCVEMTKVETMAQMRETILAECEDTDVLIMAAAVSDYRPSESKAQKIKKTGDNHKLLLMLEENPDFLSEVPHGVMKVGFAAETERVEDNAREKLKTKGFHVIVANDVTAADSGFCSETNQVTILCSDGSVERLELMTKYEVGHRILDRVANLLGDS